MALDVKNAMTNAEFDKELYIKPLDRFGNWKKEGNVNGFCRALYSTSQAFL